MNIKTIKKNDRRFFHVYGVWYKKEADSEKDICWGLYYDEEEANKSALFVRNVMGYDVVFTSRQIVWVE